MARATFVKKAQKNIYEQGKIREYVSEKGKKAGQTKQVLDRTIPANDKDKILIAAGESYYWWAFKNGPKHYSKKEPKPSQLTQSAYLATIYDLQDRMANIRENVSDADSLQTELEDIKSEIETLRDEQEEKRDNMPESLQDSDTGTLLQERYDALDSAYSELDGIDTDYEEKSDDELREELAEDIDESDLDRPDDDDEDWDEEAARRDAVTDTMIEEKKTELLEEWLDEKCEEISNVSLEG